MLPLLKMPELRLAKAELTEKREHKIVRYPNLMTVLMVEKTLKKNRSAPMSLPELKRQLPNQVMHQTLKIILAYLWKSGKIIYGPRGMQWIYSEPAHLNKMLANSLEI